MVPTIDSVASTCVAAGTSTISNYIGTNTYTFSPVGPTVDATGLVSSMVFGTSYTVTSNNGNCTSAASASFSNLDKLVTPVVPTIDSVAPTCAAAGTSTISNYIGTNTYTFSPSGPTVDATGLVSSMVFGTSYTVTSNNGSCTSVASASFSNLNKLLTPAIPTVASTAPTCAAAGTSTISNYIGTNTYTFSPVGPTVDATGLVSSMVFGTSYTVTSNNGSCTSVASASFSNLDKLLTPAIPTVASTAPTCAVAGTSTISNYIGTNTYTFSPSGPTVDATGLVSSMVFGTSYTVTSNNGSCTSVASASFSNLDKLLTPVVPTIDSVAPTCAAAGTSTISNYIGTNTYTFSPAGPTVDATGLLSSMVFGTSYTVTSNNGSCTSGASASFSNLDKLVTPAVSTIDSVAPTCAVAGTSTISNYIGTNTYTFSPAGPTVDATGLVSSMVFGTSYTVTSNNGSCTSGASASFSNLDKLVTPAVPTIDSVAPTCAAAGTSTISNYIGTNTYTFSPVGPTVDATGLVSSMVFGTSYTVTSNNGSCTSVASASFSNLDKLVTPAVPTVSSSSSVCSGSDAIFTITGTEGNIVTYSGAASGTATIGAAGTVDITITGITTATTLNLTTVSNGSCTRALSATTTVAIMPRPDAGTDGTLTICSGSTVTAGQLFAQLGGTPTAGGIWTPALAGAGTYTYAVAATTPCAVDATASVVVSEQAQPSAGTLSGIQAVCVGGNTTFSSTVTGGIWTSGDLSKATVDSLTGVITGVTAGTVTITYTVAGTGVCSDVTATRDVSVIALPVVPAITGGSINVCAGSGTVTFLNAMAGGTWSVTNGTGTASITIGGVLTGQIAGTVTVEYTMTNIIGCAVKQAFNLTINAAPNAGTLSGTQAICVSGTTTFSSTVSGGSWSSSNASIATVDPVTGLITGISSGTATITYKIIGTGGCPDATVTRTVSVYSPTVSLSGSTNVLENSIVTVDLTASLSTLSYEDVTVNLSFSGTASGLDYNASGISIVIPAGSLSGTVSIDPIDDIISEGNESVIANITSVIGGCAAENGIQTATVTIVDDEAAPMVSISNPTVTEGANAVFTVSIDNPSSVDTVVDVVTATGTAGTSDYIATTTTVTIPAGQTSVTVSVPTTDDAIDEPSESFTLNATVTSGNTSNPTATGTATINDNDATPTVSISNLTVTEGTNAVFTVSIDVASSVDTVVDVVTATGTAGTSDYTVTTTTVTIPAGQTSVTVSVPTTDDAIDEPSESFTLNATVTSGNTSNPTVTGTATITDNDIPAPAPPAIFAGDDLAGPITSSIGVQNIMNVLDNDFVDLNKATLNNVTLSTVTADSAGFMKLKLDGTIELAANTPAGTYSLTYSICDINIANNCASAKVAVTVICNLSTAISGVVYNAGTNTPLANVPVTLKPINNTTGPILLSLTKADGLYAFSGMIPGDYVLQVQDANLNAAQELFNTTPSFLILKVEDCKYQKIDFGYDKTDLLVLGDFVWYDINNNGIQDEWYDANNDGLVTQNLPDASGVVDYSKWEWIDFNGDGSYKGKENTGELNAAGFGNGTTNIPNIFVTGPNGFSRSVTMGVEGYWRTRAPKDAYGEYKIEFIKEANFEMASEAMSASGLVKVLPSATLKQANANKSKSYVDCGLTTNNILYAQFSATEKVHLDLDFGISCKTYVDIVANNDDAGTIDGLKASNGIFNAIANDTFNGLPINLSDVIVTFTPSPNFTMGTNGLLNTLSNIPGGTYTLTYSICEKANQSNCSTATVTVFVSSPSIALVKTAHFNDENADGYSQVGETITYNFEITNTGNVPLTNVTISDPLPGVVMTGSTLTLAIGETNATHFQGVYVIKQTDINKGSISNQATVFGTSPNNRVVEDKSDNINIVNDNPTVLTVSGCAIKVYNAVTPDGSDKYDKLYIQGIECYKDNSIEIFNRWGVLVFEREHYNNDDVVFRGTSEGRVTVEKSQELPAGTYFYILKYKDSESNAFEKSGYLYLNRK
ncbi:gliding motility-associated C-terminal domain-containing protein [Flavobacterium aquariorum]|uniref:T9SS type B sorting domain-containing protein n=1 Tax=Flavobacterium aquariorum TaxID=2217670 RepID=UPI001A9E71D4|nr:gliding motility-associated C-terminal domain-containing protein [Flavobacterium aquariorum]